MTAAALDKTGQPLTERELKREVFAHVDLTGEVTVIMRAENGVRTIVKTTIPELGDLLTHRPESTHA